MTLHGSVRDDSPPVDLSYPSKGAECWARCSSFCTESFHSRNPSILKIGKADSSDTSPTPHGSVPVFLAASTQQISTVFQLLWAGVPGGLSWNVQVLVSRSQAGGYGDSHPKARLGKTSLTQPLARLVSCLMGLCAR